MKRYISYAITGMGFGFPATLLCMTLFGGYNEIIREFLVWLAASVLYGVLSGLIFHKGNNLPLLAALSIHFAGCTAITLGAALLNGYISGLKDVLPVLIPAFVIYAVIYLICFLMNKQSEKSINKRLKEK